MRMPARHAATLVAAVMPLACATAEYDSLNNVQSICDVTFEVGRIVQVSGYFDGDRYHGNGLFDPECPGIYWDTDSTDAFDDRYREQLELGNAIWIGTDFSRYRIEVEGRLFIGSEGGPAIEFQKLGKSERVPR